MNGPLVQKGAPEGSFVELSVNGYIVSKVFVKWLEFFIATVHPTKERKVLLFLDDHTTHNKNLRALELARDYGVQLHLT